MEIVTNYSTNSSQICILNFLKILMCFFVECTTFLCDFHREQAWLRWLSKTENGVTSCKQKVLGMMRRCAHATQPAEYQAALGAFESSPEWTSSSKLRNWFSKQWSPQFKVIYLDASQIDCVISMPRIW